MCYVTSSRRAALGALTILFSPLFSSADAQRNQRDAPVSDREISILVTAHPQNTRMILAVLVQDDLVSRVNNEIKGVKEFIKRLPEGSRVMTGYITTGTLQVTQDFTTDRDRAASSLRIVRSNSSGAPYNPYVEVIEALRRFESQPVGRRMILLISDGLDTSHGFRSSSSMLSLDGYNPR